MNSPRKIQRHRGAEARCILFVALFAASCFGPGEHIDLNAPDAAPDASEDSGPSGDFVAFRLDTTAAGIPTTEPVTNFPLLLRLDETVLDFDAVSQDGDGIAVTGGDGTLLAHEVEQWDATAASALLWVRVPRIEPNDAAQQIRLYPAPSPPPQSQTDVFLATGFASVLHLAESGNNLLGGYADASGAGHPGTGVNRTASDQVSSVIGYGGRFADQAYIALRDFDAVPSATTLSLWFTADIADGELLSVKDSALLRLDEANDAIVGMFYDGADWRETAATLPAFDSSIYVAYTVDPATRRQVLYLNGEPSAASSYTGEIDYSVGYTAATLGVHPEEDRLFFTGTMDEVRIEIETHSDDWIKLCYENQRPDRTSPWPVPE